MIMYEADEITHSNTLFKCYQRLHLSQTIENLQKKLNNPIPRNHWPYKLTAFVGTDGSIYVGGRLTDSSLPEDVKHPKAIPKLHLLFSLLSNLRLYLIPAAQLETKKKYSNMHNMHQMEPYENLIKFKFTLI